MTYGLTINSIEGGTRKLPSDPVETRDAKRCDTAKGELLAGGGRLKVPCLRVVDTAGGESWMYESKDIIDYLEGRLAGLV